MSETEEIRHLRMENARLRDVLAEWKQAASAASPQPQCAQEPQELRDMLQQCRDWLYAAYHTGDSLTADRVRSALPNIDRAIAALAASPQCAREADLADLLKAVRPYIVAYVETSPSGTFADLLQRIDAALSGKPGAEPQRAADALMRLLAELFSESLHETWTKGEILNIIEDAIRLGSSPARPEGGRLTFCERCNANRVHVRAKIIGGVQMFECPVCAVSRPERCGGAE